MESIFRTYSPMSPAPIDHEMEALENQLQFKMAIIEDLEHQEQNEMKKFSEIINSKDRLSRSRKRQRTECTGCPSTFKNACLECKQEFASKKLKQLHDNKETLMEQIADLQAQHASHQEVRAIRRPAEIWEEARRKEIEAAQMDAEVKMEPMDEDYTAESSNRATNEGNEMQADVKTEPSDPITSIGMINTVKSEPVDESPLVASNNIFMNNEPNVAESSSEDDMNIVNVNGASDYNSLYAQAAHDAIPANDASAFEPLPWWFPYENELEAIIHSF